MVDFDTAFDRVLGSEGGYSNDPADPGGETQWGISKRSYPNVDIKNLSLNGAKAIYLRDFWMPLTLDKMPESVLFQAFDFAVNSGISTAIRKLQRAVGVADDGHWGPISQAAMARTSESDAIMRFVAERLDFWRALSTWPRFGKGWAGRAAQDLRYGAVDS
jgi:lysozyme family protein